MDDTRSILSKIKLNENSVSDSGKHSIPVKKVSISEIEDSLDNIMLIHVGINNNEDMEVRGDRK